MLDRSIPYYNIIMKKNTPTAFAPPALPPQFELHAYRSGVAQQWAELEHEIGDFPSMREARTYFSQTYLSRSDLLAQRGVFVSDKKSGGLVGAGIAWFDDQNGVPVSLLHWLITKETYQGRGIGSRLDCGCAKYLRTRECVSGLSAYSAVEPSGDSAIP